MNQKHSIAVDPEKIHLLNIRTRDSELQMQDKFTGQKPGAFEFNISLQNVRIREEKKQVWLPLSIEIIAFSNENEEMGIARYSIDFIFKVDNLVGFIEKQKEEFKINVQLGITLAAISYSTSRGILFQVMANTPFQDAVLPVIDPKTLFELNEKK